MMSVWILTLGILFIAGVLIAFAPRKRRPCRRGADMKAAMSFPLPGMAQLLADQTGIQLQEAERGEWFFRRWFVVVASCDVTIGMSSKQVDEFWHLLLEKDELYRTYSLAVCGRIIQHIEGVGGPKLEARSWVAYETIWGEPPAADLWPRPPADDLRKVRASSRTSKRGGDGSCQSGDSSGGGDGIVMTTVSDSHHSHHSSGGHHGGGGHDGGGGHGCGASSCSGSGSSCGGGCGGG